MLFYLWPSISIYFFFQWSTLFDSFGDRRKATSSYLVLKHNMDKWLNKPRFNPSLEQWPVGSRSGRRGDNMSEIKTPQVSKTLLNILADLLCSVWSWFFLWFPIFSKIFGTVQSAPTATCSTKDFAFLFGA